ncbi:MAG: hypothetical protein IKI84_12165 [Clostridia bacterium]|nr:hypothetical protein [Clostridia bacterium]
MAALLIVLLCLTVFRATCRVIASSVTVSSAMTFPDFSSYSGWTEMQPEMEKTASYVIFKWQFRDSSAREVVEAYAADAEEISGLKLRSRETTSSNGLVYCYADDHRHAKTFVFRLGDLRVNTCAAVLYYCPGLTAKESDVLSLYLSPDIELSEWLEPSPVIPPSSSNPSVDPKTPAPSVHPSATPYIPPTPAPAPTGHWEWVEVEVDCPSCVNGTCPICGGNGYVINYGVKVDCERMCSACGGKGTFIQKQYKYIIP